MPDALCKTVPIWIAVLNRLIFTDRPASHVLSTPADVVSRSEHAQIEERLPQCVSALRDLNLDVLALRSKLGGRPVRATWLTPDSELAVQPHAEPHWNHIVLCTASGRTVSGKPNTFAYVQGAADDQESWALGLTPPVFWNNSRALLSASEEDLPELIATLMSSATVATGAREPVLAKPTASIWVGSNATAESYSGDFDIVISCAGNPDDRLAEALKDGYIHLACVQGKTGSRQLRKALTKLSSLAERLSASSKVLVTCSTGRDLAIGAALALICLCCADDGSLLPPGSNPPLSKTLIKRRLSWLMVSIPDAAPSRATLQSVNAFLLS